MARTTIETQLHRYLDIGCVPSKLTIGINGCWLMQGDQKVWLGTFADMSQGFIDQLVDFAADAAEKFPVTGEVEV